VDRPGKTPRLALVSLALALFAVSPAARAGKAPGGFSAAEVSSIRPLLGRHGLVALSETHPDGSPKAMTLAIRIAAPREKVFEALGDPRNFYYLSTLFKENEILQEHDNSKAYTWASRHKLFSFTGMNTIALYPPRRADVRVAQSTIGEGVFTFVLHQDGPDHTIAVLSGILDVQSSEWLIRLLLGGNPSMRQAMNMAIGIVVIKGLKSMAEQIAAGRDLTKHRTRGKAGGSPRPLPARDLRALAPLLVRGSAVLTGSYGGGRLRQATVVEAVSAPADDVYSAVSAPRNFAKVISAFTDITVHDAAADLIDFSWTLGFSVLSLTSRNAMSKVDAGVLIEAKEGDLPGASWRWQIVPTGEKKCVVAYHSFANLRKAGYILEQTVKREPYLEHGVVAGSNMVMLRAIRMSLVGR